MKETNSRHIQSILLVLLHAFSVSVIFITVKYLSQFFRSVEIVLLYKSLLLFGMLLFSSRNGFKALHLKHSKLLMICRGLITGIASLSFLYSLQYVNIVNAIAIAYLEQIIWVLMGLFLFHEKLNTAKIYGILLSFIGAVIVIFPNILQKNSEALTFNTYYIFVFIALICWGTNAGIIKKLSRSVSAETQLLYSSFFATLISVITTLLQWKDFNIGDITVLLPAGWHSIDMTIFDFVHFKYILIITIFYFLHSTAFFFAVKKTDFALIMPYDYFRLFFSAILNYLVFDILEDWTSILGYCFIIIAGIILLKTPKQQNTSNI